MEAVGRAVRFVLVVVGIAAMAMAGSGNPSLAAVTAPTGNFAVATVQPARGELVGVAQPVVVSFTKPIADRPAAERTIHVTSSREATGRFVWVNDNVVQWVPDGFWPAHSQVIVTAGGAKTDFQAGAAVLGVASISAHTFTVSVDGQVVREMPASMGKPSRPTPVGSFSVLEKNRSVVMDSRTIGIPLSSPEGYRITAQYAERITWGGVYVHSAPWSVDSQGNTNVSHGCINLSPDNAAWYFNTVSVGDPVIVQP
jgi:lipoprotein-anchoring transpeptidase ErfK/SrfK